MPAAWYKFDLGPARFIALDTNWIKMHADDRGQAAEVSSWLSGFKGWRIVFGHHPWVSDGPHGNAGSYDGSGPGSSPEASGARLATFFRSSILGFVFVTLDATSLKIEFRDSDGVLLHTLKRFRPGA